MEIIIAVLSAWYLQVAHAQWVKVTVDLNTDNKYVLSCPLPKDTNFVLWYKYMKETMEDVELEFSNRIFFPALNQVELRSLRESDSGIYKCKDVRRNNVIKTFQIKVIRKSRKEKQPEWLLTPSELTTVDSSRAVIMPCRATDSDVKITAFRMLKSGGKKKLPNAGVVLHKPKGSDSGKYMCRAENEAGVKMHLFNIVVKVNGRFSQWSDWSKCGVECGYGVKSRSRACNNPKAENGGRRCHGKTSERRHCRETSCTTPRLVAFGFDMVGPNLILTCVSKGMPLPTVRWKFNGRQLHSNYHQVAHKTIIPKHKARSGSYSCTIRNSAGYYTKYIRIDV